MQNRKPFPWPLGRPSSTLVGSSIWLVVGFVGGGVAAAELVQVLAGVNHGLAVSIAWIASGAGAATFAWRSSWRMLTEEVRPPVAVESSGALAGTPATVCP